MGYKGGLGQMEKGRNGVGTQKEHLLVPRILSTLCTCSSVN